MKTRDTQGSFIILIWALIAKVEQLTNVPGVSTYPRAELVADLLLRPLVCRSMQRQQAEEARLSQRVFRYSGSHPSTPSCASSSLSRLLG
jgi:hypothetical protein